MTTHDAESADSLLAELARLRSDVIAAHATRDQAIRAAEAANAAAAKLLVEATLARAMVEALEAGIARDGYCPICHQTERVTLQTGYYTHHEGCALAVFQAVQKAKVHD